MDKLIRRKFREAYDLLVTAEKKSLARADKKIASIKTKYLNELQYKIDEK